MTKRDEGGGGLFPQKLRDVIYRGPHLPFAAILKLTPWHIIVIIIIIITHENYYRDI